jgi:hypothetical protein
MRLKFICHSDSEAVEYKTVVKWLNDEMKADRGFRWKNCCRDDIVFGTRNLFERIQHKRTLKEYIYSSDVVIVISDMYRFSKYWINFEIDKAKSYNKYIIGLRPWRSLNPTPKKIAKNADILINLKSDELIDAINAFCGETNANAESEAENLK